MPSSPAPSDVSKQKNSPEDLSSEEIGVLEMVSDDRAVAGGGKTTSVLKPSPILGMNLGNLPEASVIGSGRNGSSENSSVASMVDEAWEQLNRSFVKFQGQSVGTLSFIDTRSAAFNYSQVLDIKLIDSPQQRYCLLLLDSVAGQQNMLTTQLNDRVKSSGICKGSLIHLVCNIIQNLKIIMVLNMGAYIIDMGRGMQSMALKPVSHHYLSKLEFLAGSSGSSGAPSSDSPTSPMWKTFNHAEALEALRKIKEIADDEKDDPFEWTIKEMDSTPPNEGPKMVPIYERMDDGNRHHIGKVYLDQNVKGYFTFAQQIKKVYPGNEAGEEEEGEASEDILLPHLPPHALWPWHGYQTTYWKRDQNNHNVELNPLTMMWDVFAEDVSHIHMDMVEPRPGVGVTLLSLSNQASHTSLYRGFVDKFEGNKANSFARIVHFICSSWKYREPVHDTTNDMACGSEVAFYSQGGVAMESPWDEEEIVTEDIFQLFWNELRLITIQERLVV